MMTKTALENKKIAKDLEASKYSADKKLRGEYVKAKPKEQEIAMKKEQFEKEHKRKWAETGSKIGGTVLETAGKIIASAINDPEFYLSIPGIGDKVGSLPTFYPLGSHISRGKGGGTLRKVSGPHPIPSVMGIITVPTFGPQALSGNVANPNSNLNLAMSRFVTEARKYNSRIGEYEPGDAGQILIAGVSILERMTFIRKMLAVYNLVDAGRLNIARAIFVASGVTFDIDTRQQCLDKFAFLREKVNETLYIPKPFNYAERKMQFANVLYGDQDLRFGQYFTTYRPCRISYDEENAVCTVHTSGMPGTATLSSLLTEIEEDLNNLHYSQVLTTFWSDIRAAYQESYSIPAAEKGDQLVIKPVDEALHQVLNISCPPIITKEAFLTGMSYWNWRYVEEASLAIRQDSRGLLYQGSATNRQGPRFYDSNRSSTAANCSIIALPEALYQEKNLLNFYTDNVGVEEIMVATRLHPTWTTVSDGTVSSIPQVNVVPLTCGTEVCVGMRMAYVEATPNGNPYTCYNDVMPQFCLQWTTPGDDEVMALINNQALNYDQLELLADYLSFDWVPPVYSFVCKQKLSTEGNTIPNLKEIINFKAIWQIGNLLPVATQNYQALDQAAILSEFSTPIKTTFAK